MSSATITNVKTRQYNNGTIERHEFVAQRWNRNTGRKSGRVEIKWRAYDRHGNTLRTKDRGQTLREAKRAIDKAHAAEARRFVSVCDQTVLTFSDEQRDGIKRVFGLAMSRAAMPGAKLEINTTDVQCHRVVKTHVAYNVTVPENEIDMPYDQMRCWLSGVVWAAISATLI